MAASSCTQTTTVSFQTQTSTERSSPLFFFSHVKRKANQTNHVFSQWFPSPFVEQVVLDSKTVEIKYVCAEQYMMAKKALLFASGQYIPWVIHRVSSCSSDRIEWYIFHLECRLYIQREARQKRSNLGSRTSLIHPTLVQA